MAGICLPLKPTGKYRKWVTQSIQSEPLVANVIVAYQATGQFTDLPQLRKRKVGSLGGGGWMATNVLPPSIDPNALGDIWFDLPEKGRNKDISKYRGGFGFLNDNGAPLPPLAAYTFDVPVRTRDKNLSRYRGGFGFLNDNIPQIVEGTKSHFDLPINRNPKHSYTGFSAEPLIENFLPITFFWTDAPPKGINKNNYQGFQLNSDPESNADQIAGEWSYNPIARAWIQAKNSFDGWQQNPLSTDKIIQDFLSQPIFDVPIRGDPKKYVFIHTWIIPPLSDDKPFVPEPPQTHNQGGRNKKKLSIPTENTAYLDRIFGPDNSKIKREVRQAVKNTSIILSKPVFDMLLEEARQAIAQDNYNKAVQAKNLHDQHQRELQIIQALVDERVKQVKVRRKEEEQLLALISQL